MNDILGAWTARENNKRPQNDIMLSDPAQAWHAHGEQLQPKERGSDTKRQELKNALESELKALISSIGIKVAQQEHKHGKSKSIGQLLGMQRDAQGVLNVLEGQEGTAYQLQALMGRESVIRVTFTDQQSKKKTVPLPPGADDDDDDGDDEAQVAKPRRPSLGSATAYHHICAHRQRFHHAVVGQEAIIQHSESVAEQSRNDILATTAVAAAMHDGQDYEGMLAKRRNELAVAPGATEEEINRHMVLIEREAAAVSSSMKMGDGHMRAAMLEAVRELTNYNLSEHEKICLEHFSETRAALASFGDPKLLEHFEQQTQDWQKSMQDTRRSFNEAIDVAHGQLSRNANSPAASREELMRVSVSFDDTFAGLDGNMMKSVAHLENQLHSLAAPLAALERAENDFNALRQGDHNGDVPAIAKLAGTATKTIYHEIAAYRKTQEIAPETDAQIDDRAHVINGLWQALFPPQRARGMPS